MTNIAILGTLWGDEGKGRITHSLSSQYDWIIRYSGGNNAGHTIYRNGVKYVHNLLPSFDWRDPNQKCFLASGMVIDVEQLYNEVFAAEKAYSDYTGLIDNKLNRLGSRIYVDPDAFVVLPGHKEEDKAANVHIGSTNRGIGPAYKSKVGRCGVRIIDLIRSSNSFINKLINIGVHFKHVLELKKCFSSSNLLFEGAQGVMLDLNHGVYPYVSCGDATVAGIYASGFANVKLDAVYGVSKAYLTKVGEGPFPTEIFGEQADALREQGKEYGATTGRPRRVGWLDLAALNYAIQKGGINKLILTKFDVLYGMDEVKLCVNYDKEPVCPSDFYDAKPQYITVPGWKSYNDKNLKDFIKIIEETVKCSVEYISCGIKDEDFKPIIVVDS
ncbi:MAG: adenylosuccinate synthetase [Ferruginibacter sp.]